MNYKKQSSITDVSSSPLPSNDGPSLILQEPQGREIVVIFQCGLEKEAFVLEAKDINSVKEQACIFLETKVILDSLVVVKFFQ